MLSSSSTRLQPQPPLADVDELVGRLLSVGQVVVVPAQETQPFHVGAAAVRPVVEMVDLARPRRRVAALVTAVLVTVDHGAGLGGSDAAGEPADVQRHRVRVRQQPHDTGVAGQATSRIAPQVGARVQRAPTRRSEPPARRARW